ncbi:MAG: DPP IV N-terminal domain-containing protein [Gemmatimonadota bacterium]
MSRRGIPRFAIAVVAALAAGRTAELAAQTTRFQRFGAILTGQAVKLVGAPAVRWLPGRMGYLEEPTDTATNRFLKVDPLTGAKTPLLSPAALAKLLAQYAKITGHAAAHLPFRQFDFVGENFLTFDEPGFRFVFSVDSAQLHRIPLPAKTGPLNQSDPEPGKFSPDFRRYAFIRDYDNIWLFDPSTGKEEQLVTGTSDDNLIGFLDAGPWFVWSADGKRIAYFKANQQAMYRYPLLRDLDPHATVTYFRYPFTTDPNPVLELHVIDVATKKDALVAKSTVEKPFLREITWFPDSKEFAFQVVDQWESRLELLAADAATGATRPLLVDSDPAFLDPLHNFWVLADRHHFLWSSEQSGWRHIYLHDSRGGTPKQLTSGDFVTKNVLGVDEKKGVVYFTGATRLGLEQHLFRVGLDGTGLTRFTSEPGWHEPFVDSALTTFLDRHSSLTRPWTVVLKTIDGKPLKELAHSDTSALHTLGITGPELITLKAADGVTDIHGHLFKPADFDPAKRYPMVVEIYGGPHTKAIRDRYDLDFGAGVAQLGFLVFQVDGRGTIDREKRFQTGNYLKMGQIDIDDQAAAVRQLRIRSYVDSTRVGITGSSHGGYLTIMAVLRYPDVYQVGVAGVPMSDLKNGPRQYIGRIMRTPDANPDGYAKADPLPLAGTLKGRLMIMYGTGDQNAVTVNSMQMIRKLIDAGRPVDVTVYPEGHHVLDGPDAMHSIKTTISYMLEHLRPEGWEASRDALWQ